jgi:hypothetical protein
VTSEVALEDAGASRTLFALGDAADDVVASSLGLLTIVRFRHVGCSPEVRRGGAAATVDPDVRDGVVVHGSSGRDRQEARVRGKGRVGVAVGRSSARWWWRPLNPWNQSSTEPIAERPPQALNRFGSGRVPSARPGFSQSTVGAAGKLEA